ncbi:DUF2911 domain-containing protein [Mucilaginibacter celer]|uniref:DUF2911 domain-containing protein n=1 Tax=Mucilaginibacter celer TaxID=2305508 RepID=A0A494VKW9_9SPHI|nr:DUF2911 domain-containing protein [Mucilaginibacter celer]AYL94131.1 DUF2911 domain-containing protein [Mucilaginibacter celer]
MKKSFQLKAAFLFAFALLVSSFTFAQQKPMASPRDSVSGTAAGSTITINYGSPSVKGRKIWGGLEAYGKVWRAGANEATTFTTTKAIKVEGKPLAAGTYGFFLIPEENGTWTVIFNKVAKQWGAFKYDDKEDALRVTVKTKAAPMHERLTYTVDSKSFCMFWDKIVVPVSVK